MTKNTKEEVFQDQYVVTYWTPGGEHADETRQFDNYNSAAEFAWAKQKDPDVSNVVFRSRRVKYTPWKVYAIHEPDHY